jgi:hypothetical protein
MQRFAFEQAAPGQALGQYGNIVAGTILPGTVTATGGGGGGLSPLQAGIGGAATGYSMGGLPGAAVGGILGLLS